MRKSILALIVAVVFLLIMGCGSQSSVDTGTSPSVSTASVGLTVTDTPPAGVTVLFFQLGITEATLQPGNVSLLRSTNPIPVNVSQLQTESAFLGSANVAAGNYTSLSLTFANPQLTIYNGTGADIGSCANNTVCRLTPAVTPLTLNFSTAPFPLTLTANSSLAFKLDIHLDTVIQSDLTVDLATPNGVTLSQLTAPPRQPIPALGKLTGTVQTVGTNQFTLQGMEGRTFTILVNDSTTYSFPSSVCPAGAFSCLAAGQVVKVLVSLQSDGSLLAQKVEYFQPATQQSVEGSIVGLSTSGTDTVMDLILQVQPMNSMSAMLPVGHHVRVTVPSTGVTYAVNWGSFTPPSGLSFSGASDLQVGQEVLVVVQGSVTAASDPGTNGPTIPDPGGSTGSAPGGSTGSTPGGSTGLTPVGPANITFTTNSITLEPSQITGTVAATNAGALSFSLATRPASFMAPSATVGARPTFEPVIITVQTTTATTFKNFTPNDISGLTVNDVVSVHGWLFSTPTAAPKTTIAADSVLKRPAPTASF